MKNKWNSLLSNILILLSDTMIVFSIIVLVGLHFQNEATGYFGRGSIKVATVFMIINIIASVMLNMYKLRFKQTNEMVMCEVITGIIAGFGAVVYAIIDKAYDFTQIAIQYTIIVSVLLSIIALCVWRFILMCLVNRFHIKDKLMVIEHSSDDEENSIAKKIKYTSMKWFDTWYMKCDFENDDKIAEMIGKISEYDSVMITQSIPEKAKRKITDAAIGEGKSVYIVPTWYDINLTKYSLIQFDDVPTFFIKPFNIERYQQFVKRCMDIVLSVIGIVVTSPIMLAAAILIKCDSKGPVIYQQERVTKNRKKFFIYKFRTMVDDAEKESGPRLASSGDVRITKVGKVLRAWRIDELPQMFNILKGDMSVVGPRPERPVFVDKFCERYQGYDKRFIVKAGLTGYAQTYGKYDTDVRDKMLYDLLYIREYSLALDIKIILLTLKTILTHNG